MFIHLNPIGGIAGDMFIAAMLDAWPELKPKVFDAMRQTGLPPDWSLELNSASSSSIMGKKLIITGDANNTHFSTGNFKDICKRLSDSALPPAVIERAIDIFHRLALAEGVVHGKSIDAVHFHEIADWDSICDIVGTATILDLLNCSEWSVDDIPMGSGTINTAHGLMPVPAPATSQLLKGYIMADDGISGERVTPTGAAILTHIAASQNRKRNNGRLIASGYGLGTKELKGVPNMLRILAFEEATAEVRTNDEVGEITFEVDDQTGEELAVALDILRATQGVLDVVQYMVFGKKGRLATSVRVLCYPSYINQAIEQIFLQTTTIGLRKQILNRSVLSRENISLDGVSAKKSIRPDGVITIKADMDELMLNTSTQAERSLRRNQLLQGATKKNEKR